MFELIAAPHTPFDANGELNLDMVARQADHMRAVGVHGVLVAGSTGEGPSLTSAERRLLAERWVEAGGGLRVLIQVGHPSLRESRDLARHASRIGAAAVCAAPPSWFPILTAEQLAATCETIAAAAPDLPFLYYHIPELSGVQVQISKLLDLVVGRIPNFAGVKYTHVDPVDFEACVRGHGADVQLLWGTDDLLVTGLDLGARGAIGSTYNFSAPLAHDLIAAHGAGDVAKAQEVQSRVALLIETLARRGYAAAAKTVMKFLGIDCGPVRLPLLRLDAAGEAELRSALEQIGFFDWISQRPDRA